jgi:hypothetical protein
LNRANNIVRHGRIEPKASVDDLDLSQPVALVVLSAIRHYEVGVRIGELSLGPGFGGLLPWGYLDNRPFLRCLNGFGLCLWRLSRFAEAERVFDRMLGLNPNDNQGVRFLIDKVRAQKPGTDERDQ